jgi:hypothetical protein
LGFVIFEEKILSSAKLIKLGTSNRLAPLPSAFRKALLTLKSVLSRYSRKSLWFKRCVFGSREKYVREGSDEKQ